MKIVMLGLSITSSWGNGHATNYRALARALDARGHEVQFLERDVPWYAPHRDLPHPPYAATRLYDSVDELMARYGDEIHSADLVCSAPTSRTARRSRASSSRPPEVVAFYDIDTPVTLAALAAGTCDYVAADIIPQLDLYLSFTGGPALDHLAEHTAHAAPARSTASSTVSSTGLLEARAASSRWAFSARSTRIGSTRSSSCCWSRPAPPRRVVRRRRPAVPRGDRMAPNVRRVEHVPPSEHRAFYASQRLTLNLTRRDMIEWGWSPSVRLFEAAACGVPIVSDWWSGLDSFFEPESEILIARSAGDVVESGHGARRRRVAAIAAARARSRHTRAQRAPARGGAREPRRRVRGSEGPMTLEAPAARDHEIAALGPWFHNLHLPDGRQTAPGPSARRLPGLQVARARAGAARRPLGLDALDIGCNAGYYSFQLARLGALVVAIDHDERYLAQAAWARSRFGLDDQVELRRMTVYDLAGETRATTWCSSWGCSTTSAIRCWASTSSAASRAGCSCSRR